MEPFAKQALSIHVEQLFLRYLSAAGITDSLARLVLHAPNNKLAEQIVALLKQAAADGAPDEAPRA